MRAESKAVEVVKRCSTLELDLKQSLQKMEQLMKQKERLEDEVRKWRRWRRRARREGDRPQSLGRHRPWTTALDYDNPIAAVWMQCMSF